MSRTQILWTSCDKLLPAGEGFLQYGETLGETAPKGKYAARGSGRLTWVAEFPSAAEYEVWVRQYGGYGSVRVSVDEEPVTSISRVRAAGGVKYIWCHQGSILISAGQHHVDVDVKGGIVDAILFETDPNFRPDEEELPPPASKVVVSLPRRYRSDAHLVATAGATGFVVANVGRYDWQLNDYVPAATELLPELSLWGCAGQSVSGAFAVRALKPIGKFTLSVEKLEGPKGFGLSAADIDLRVVMFWELKRSLYSADGAGLTPDLLLRDDRSGIPPKGPQGGFGGGVCTTQLPAHESRQFWLTVQVPSQAPAGEYRGHLTLKSEGRERAVPVRLEILPMELRPVDGHYSICFPNEAIKDENILLSMLKDQVRHGLNTSTAYQGAKMLPLMKQAGMTAAPCLMQWPDSNPAENPTELVARAKVMGFADLYFYGVDEPKPGTPRLELCRKEAERRLVRGFHMMTGINDEKAYEELWEVVDRPILNILRFFGTVLYDLDKVKAKGYQPTAYWVTAPPYPLLHRALAGLFNRACGFIGTCPWSYADEWEVAYEKPGETIMFVYPDESRQPIPTLRWEAFREGIDDVRYLQALDRAIAGAEKRLAGQATEGLQRAVAAARTLRREKYESIKGKYFDYVRETNHETLDHLRREMAETTIAITKAMQ
ncbi:MAG: DUF4091 domain-containing protein [Verrucomicrobia bacterium]|nr:DUF4091 domain-containing protein [Verrucomicrobiota bacterium]